jgi:hypothetical protein
MSSRALLVPGLLVVLALASSACTAARVQSAAGGPEVLAGAVIERFDPTGTGLWRGVGPGGGSGVHSLF